jgi:hypothetical protein
MQDWMGVPLILNAIAATLEHGTETWQRLLNGTFHSDYNPVTAYIQCAVYRAAQIREVPDTATATLHQAMRIPFTFQEFEHHLATTGKSPGPSGLTTTQMKNWGPETAEMVFHL